MVDQPDDNAGEVEVLACRLLLYHGATQLEIWKTANRRNIRLNLTPPA